MEGVGQVSIFPLNLSYRKDRFYFNDALYLWLYGVGHMVKVHSDRERGTEVRPPHGLLFPINSKGSFISIITQTHTTVFVTPVVGHWMERSIHRFPPLIYRLLCFPTLNTVYIPVKTQ